MLGSRNYIPRAFSMSSDCAPGRFGILLLNTSAIKFTKTGPTSTKALHQGCEPIMNLMIAFKNFIDNVTTHRKFITAPVVVPFCKAPSEVKVLRVNHIFLGCKMIQSPLKGSTRLYCQSQDKDAGPLIEERPRVRQYGRNLEKEILSTLDKTSKSKRGRKGRPFIEERPTVRYSRFFEGNETITPPFIMNTKKPTISDVMDPDKRFKYDTLIHAFHNLSTLSGREPPGNENDISTEETCFLSHAENEEEEELPLSEIPVQCDESSKDDSISHCIEIEPELPDKNDGLADAKARILAAYGVLPSAISPGKTEILAAYGLLPIRGAHSKTHILHAYGLPPSTRVNIEKEISAAYRVLPRYEDSNRSYVLATSSAAEEEGSAYKMVTADAASRKPMCPLPPLGPSPTVQPASAPMPPLPGCPSKVRPKRRPKKTKKRCCNDISHTSSTDTINPYP